MRGVKEHQLSLGNRQEYRGYEIVEVDGLVPYAILSPRGQFVSFRSSVGECRARIDALVPQEVPVESGAVDYVPLCNTCSSQDCEGCPTRRDEPEDVQYGESDKSEEEESEE